jgi:hypothetical protein
VDPKVRELAFLSGIACLALGLAWFYEADYFAIFFAVAAAIAVVEAVRRSLGCRASLPHRSSQSFPYHINKQHYPIGYPAP